MLNGAYHYLDLVKAAMRDGFDFPMTRSAETTSTEARVRLRAAARNRRVHRNPAILVTPTVRTRYVSCSRRELT
jgi:hypothetical protein